MYPSQPSQPALTELVNDSIKASRAMEPRCPGWPWPPHSLGQFFFFQPAGDLSEAQRSLLSEVCVLASLILVMPATNAFILIPTSLISYLIDVGNDFVRGSKHHQSLFGMHLHLYRRPWASYTNLVELPLYTVTWHGSPLNCYLAIKKNSDSVVASIATYTQDSLLIIIFFC